MKRKFALMITAAILATGCNITSADTGTPVSVDLGNIKESTYKITKGGTYTLSGSYKGMVVIDTNNSVSLVLNNADIENSTGPAVYGENCAKLTIETAKDSNNTLTDGTEYSNDGKGCVFANDDIVLQGNGVLNVNANYNHGIVSDDGVDIENGTININSVGDGIHANDDVLLKGGKVTITSKEDGIQAEKNVNIEGGDLSVTATGEVAESTDSDFMGKGGMPFENGERPNMREGEPPHMPDGERPEMPEDFRGHRGNMTEMTTAFDSPSQVTTVAEGSTETTTEYPSSKGIKADNDITVKGGSINVSSNDHCIKSANMTTIENGSIVLASSKSKGIKAEGDLIINGGDISADTKDECIESKAIATINGGNINIKSDDDGINAGGSSGLEKMGDAAESSEHQIIINGGNIHIDANGDGIDSNGDLSINGGVVTIDGPSNSGNGALDYAVKGSINGGSVIALGAAGMAQCPDSGKQNILNITFDSVQPADASVEIKDSKGNTAGEIRSSKEFQNMIFSSENIKEGETYTVYIDGNKTVEITAQKGITAYGQSGRAFGRGGFGGKGGRMSRENTVQNTTASANL